MLCGAVQIGLWVCYRSRCYQLTLRQTLPLGTFQWDQSLERQCPIILTNGPRTKLKLIAHAPQPLTPCRGSRSIDCRGGRQVLGLISVKRQSLDVMTTFDSMFSKDRTILMLALLKDRPTPGPHVARSLDGGSAGVLELGPPVKGGLLGFRPREDEDIYAITQWATVERKARRPTLS